MAEMVSHFDAQDLKVITQKYTPCLIKYLFCVPVLKGIRTLPLLKMDLVESLSIDYDYTIQAKETGISLIWHSGKSLDFDYICDCTGVEKDVRSAQCPLIKDAPKDGKIRGYVPKTSSKNQEIYDTRAVDINIKDFTLYDAKETTIKYHVYWRGC